MEPAHLTSRPSAPGARRRRRPARPAEPVRPDRPRRRPGDRRVRRGCRGRPRGASPSMPWTWCSSTHACPSSMPARRSWAPSARLAGHAHRRAVLAGGARRRSDGGARDRRAVRGPARLAGGPAADQRVAWPCAGWRRLRYRERRTVGAVDPPGGSVRDRPRADDPSPSGGAHPRDARRRPRGRPARPAHVLRSAAGHRGGRRGQRTGRWPSRRPRASSRT